MSDCRAWSPTPVRTTGATPVRRFPTLRGVAWGKKAKIEQQRIAVRTHINQEENDIFPKLRDNFSDEQQKQIATEFKTAKSKLQDQMTAS
ncbi:hypothetical protein [Tolypothrix sp. NIES-4075]|uniref:hypothetical protein n=1 Tax=Tolypothrix sp. NIES-4075 TaxID=2005459 RepID=UPI001F33F2DD|nr:hypothetical protein [Tolypothrix sp. NIES-4075]